MKTVPDLSLCSTFLSDGEDSEFRALRNLTIRLKLNNTGVYILENTPLGGGGISADVIWREKYEKAKRKRRKM
jgi:hypothetical protein